jgi:hypothetical protein
MNAALIYDTIKKHKQEILKWGDWWYGFDTHSINVHCPDEEYWEEPDALYSINVYAVGANGMDDYSVQYDLPPMTRLHLQTF